MAEMTVSDAACVLDNLAWQTTRLTEKELQALDIAIEVLKSHAGP